jgi:AcrR family transcriptional regulator
LDEQKSNQCSQLGQSISDENHQTEARRYGEVLENAILQAAWDELSEVGYAHLTMEAVAVRARTNKTAVYRRWPNKSELVVAALGKYGPKFDIEAPNTGDLRNDVLILLRSIAQPLQIIGAETIHGLMIEYLGKDLIIKRPGAEDELATAMMTILKNAELRKEVNLKNISPQVISLPADLLRYEFLTTHAPVSDETVKGIVDDIFMPLVRAYLACDG